MQPIRGIAPAVRIPRLAPHNATESTVASARPRLIAPPHHCIAPSKNAKTRFPPEALLHTVRTSSPRPTRQRDPDPVKRSARRIDTGKERNANDPLTQAYPTLEHGRVHI